MIENLHHLVTIALMLFLLGSQSNRSKDSWFRIVGVGAFVFAAGIGLAACSSMYSLDETE